MLIKEIISDKTLEGAIEKAVIKLNTIEENLFFKETEIEGKLFKAKKVEITVFLKEEIIEMINEHLKDLLNLTNNTAKIETKIINNVIIIDLDIDNSSIMIGKGGKTLYAFDTLLKTYLKNKLGIYIDVEVDICNYRKNKKDKLLKEIKQIANEVLISKNDKILDAMPSEERKLIHNFLKDYPELKSESEGTGFNRYVIIKYVGK